MATTLIDSVIHWRKKLDKNLDEDTILNVIRKLSKIPITLEILEVTHIGKTIRKLSKRHDIVGEKASAVLRKWRDAFTNSEEPLERNSKSISVSKKENINQKKNSYSKNEVSNEKSVYKKETPNKFEHHHDTNSLSHKTSQQYTLSNTCNSGIYNDPAVIPSHRNLLYTYEKNETQSAYKADYDPHIGESEGYNPECPELFPGEKSLKTKKLDVLQTNELSQKRKIKTEEQSESSKKSKKSKGEIHESSDSVYAGESKRSQEKKEKLSPCDAKSHSSNVKRELTANKIKPNGEHATKHKLSSDTKKSKGKDKECNEKSTKCDKSKLKLKLKSTEEFTSSEVRFEDCLGFNDIVTVKKKKSSKLHLPSKKITTTTADRNEKKSKRNISSAQENKKVSKDSSHSSKEKVQINVPKPSSKLSVVDIVSTLPETQPNYQPLPQRNLDFYSPKKKEILTNEDAIRFTSSRREKTAVYSGRRNFLTEVPSLFECCTRVLIENIDAIEYLGQIPYFIVKPVLERCTPAQLFVIEDHNPGLLDSTNELWEIHCRRDYKLLRPQENETWRDLYLRAYEERENKLKRLTANISASMSKSNPARQVKLAFVDSIAKPPRDIARRQAKNGTARPVNTPVKAAPSIKLSATTSKSAPTTVSTSSSAAVSTSSASFPPKKPKVAPLMAKTLKSMKQCFRR